ncbi:XRE family transcriptional regulator [Lentilactobacillus sp. G22-6]|uniref:spr1629 family repressor/antitoxin n=1 Tax=Lentilactobacillus dabitei TaxID=2831523 RepID=UPI001C256B3F|nr:XRE family transcriptional regulator [Lentilactobacillus dabitei]MBU9789745.1 XRE family transcriptional regulator [Lentilactobacillus dabitei]
MFYGENVKALRNLCGMSRRNLGKMLSISEQAVGQYENNGIQPEMMNILKLSRFFKVKSSFFFTKPLVDNITNEEAIAYRSADRNSRKNVREGATQIDFASAIIDYCESFLTLKQNVLKQAVALTKKIESSNVLDRQEVIEQTASMARDLLKVRSNEDLLFYVENAGAYVFEKKLALNAGAYSAWTRFPDGSLKSPFIVLGVVGKSAVRRIFDVAHELGHLILHSDIDFNMLDSIDFKRYEYEANQFASAFLLPKPKMKELMRTVRKKSVPDDYLAIKQDYWVSLTTVEYRGFKLGLVTSEENKRFFANRYKKHYVSREPLDSIMAIKRPGKIVALFKLVNDKVMPFSEVLDHFRVEPSFVAEIFRFSDSFISGLVSNDERFY